nr:protein unc-93 homolog A-like isoform X1 [Ciona intestinalis]|eukprot:XP_026692178.1 protein unc-93 homolog A-like isoform X1 [Ciona intestinalis]
MSGCYPVSFSEPYILIPAGVIVGMGESVMWPVMMVYVVHFARRFAKFGSKDTTVVITEFTGYFFCIFQISQTLGNLLSYAILYAGKTVAEGEGSNSSALADLSICGVNDCQLPNTTNLNLNQYVPQSGTVLYVMIGVMAFLVLSSIGIMGVLVKKIDPSLEIQDKKGHITSFCKTVSRTYEVLEIEQGNLNTETTFQYIRKSVTATFKHLIHPKQLLITPFALYSGLFMSFIFAEMPRAYASCMLGVAQVGLCLALCYTCDAIVSYFCCKVTSKIGRVIPITVVALIDIGNYIFLLFWIPTSSTTWLVYVIFAVFGCLDGVWNPQVNDIHGSHFPENQDMAFVVWNLWTLVGIAIQYGWSTSLCVNVKIYIQLGLLCFSLFCYSIAEYRITQEKNRANKEKGTYYVSF